MKLTPQQAHVLDNLDRVIPLDYKVPRVSSLPRFQLNGRECTAQITGLVNRNLVTRYADGRLTRAAAHKGKEPVGERQPPSVPTVDLVRSFMSQPTSVHKDPQSASARAAKIAP